VSLKIFLYSGKPDIDPNTHKQTEGQ